MRLTSLLGSAAFVVVACLASCGGATETELFGGGSASSSGTNTASSSGTSGGTSGTSGASGTSGSSGASGTSGSSGTSGTSGSSGTSGTSGSSGTSGKPDGGGGDGCKPDTKDCKSDEYCKVSGCAAAGGTCVKRPIATAMLLSPVCGCDGVTYWNGDVAAAHGVNLSGSGVCQATARACSAIAPCDGKAKCNLDQGTKQQCSILTPTGACWQLPTSCPDNGNAGAQTRACVGLGDDDCLSYCDAVDKEAAFYKVNNCQ